jgi:hypothetical protein
MATTTTSGGRGLRPLLGFAGRSFLRLGRKQWRILVESCRPELCCEGRNVEANVVLEGVARGEFHQEGALKCSELYTVDPAFFSALKDELCTLVARNTPSEVQEEDHITNWTKPIGRAIRFSSLNESGDFDDTGRDHQLTIHGKRFHDVADYPSVGAFIAMFPHAINMRVNGMSPRGGSPHTKNTLAGESVNGSRILTSGRQSKTDQLGFIGRRR